MLTIVFFIIALIFFILAAAGVNSARVPLLALGLVSLTLAFLVGALAPVLH